MRATNDSLSGGASFGIGQVNNNFYAGIEGSFNFENNKTHIDILYTEVNTDLIGAINTEIKLRHQFALLAKFGITSNIRTLFYGLIGPQWGYFHMHGSAGYEQFLGLEVLGRVQNSPAGYESGLLLGLGIAHLLTKNFSIGIEYRYSFYGLLKSAPLNLIKYI